MHNLHFAVVSSCFKHVTGYYRPDKYHQSHLERLTLKHENIPHQSKMLTLYSKLLYSRKVGVRSFSEGYNPELPVLKSAGFYIFIKLLLHVVEAMPSDGDPRLGELLLTQAVKTIKVARVEDSYVMGHWGDTCAMLTYFMDVLSSSISSRSLLTSSCNCCLSCWSFPMCSTVFCNVTALLL